MEPETLLNHFAEDRHGDRGAVVPPIYQNSLFVHDSWEAIDGAFDDPIDSPLYSRGYNPTVRTAEEKLAALAGGERAQLFASGMAAIAAVAMHCLEPGSHLVTVKNIYGPARSLFHDYLVRKLGITISEVDGGSVDEFREAIRDDTCLIYLESPSSAVFTLQDLGAVAELAKGRGIATAVDNSWATPVFQKPLGLGIDYEIHSCSKYIGGHSDVVAGVVIGSDDRIRELFYEYQHLGATMAPIEAWLVLRSLRTLVPRMRVHQDNAMAVAGFLERHPLIESLRYPGLPSFPQAGLAARQMSGFSGMMSFRLKTDELDRIKRFVNSLKLFQVGVSWGGHESLVFAPAIAYLKEHSPEQFAAMGISLADIRISVGLENQADLLADLGEALEAISS